MATTETINKEIADEIFYTNEERIAEENENGQDLSNALHCGLSDRDNRLCLFNTLPHSDDGPGSSPRNSPGLSANRQSAQQPYFASGPSG